MNAHTLYIDEGSDRQMHLWVPDYQENNLKQVTRLGMQRVASGLNGPWGITAISDGLITNLLGNSITRVSRSGDVTSVLEGLSSPTGIVNTDEHVFVANNGAPAAPLSGMRWTILLRRPRRPPRPPIRVWCSVSGLQNTALDLTRAGW